MSRYFPARKTNENALKPLQESYKFVLCERLDENLSLLLAELGSNDGNVHKMSRIRKCDSFTTF